MWLVPRNSLVLRRFMVAAVCRSRMRCFRPEIKDDRPGRDFEVDDLHRCQSFLVKIATPKDSKAIVLPKFKTVQSRTASEVTQL